MSSREGRLHPGFHIAGYTALVVGISALLGWALDIAYLKSIVPGVVATKPNTAAAFVAVGISLLSLRRFPILVRVCAVLVAGIALANLAQSLFEVNLGIDELLFRDRDPVLGNATPGRMAFTTALCLLIGAVVLLLLAWRRPGARMPFIIGWLGSMIFAMGFFSGLATWSGFAQGYSWEMWTSMSFPSAFLFMVIGAALLWNAWSESAGYWRSASWLTAVFMVGVVLLAFVAVGFDANNRELIRSAKNLSQTRENLSALDQFLDSFEKLEEAWHNASLQGQALSDKDLRPVRTAVEQLRAMPLSVSQRQVLREISADLKRAAAILSTAITADAGATERAVEELEAIHRRMHANAMIFRQTEISVLGTHAQRSEASARNASFLLPMSTFLSLVLLTSAFFLLNSEISGRQQVVEALRQSEERFRTLADLIPQHVWIADPNGEPIWYNQRYCEYTGMSNQQMLEIGWQNLTEPSVIPKVLEGWGKAVKTGNPFEGEITLRAADGHYRRFLSLAMPLRDEKGRILRWFGTNTDIEESKRVLAELERKEVQLRFSQQVGRVGGFEWDFATNRVDWSNELEAIYGLPPGAFGCSYEAWAACVHPEDLPEAQRRITEALETGLFLAEFRIIWPDKTIHWLGGRGSVIRDEQGNPVRMVGVNYDITEMKQAEEKVRELNVELERRVQERTSQLQIANKELESFSYSVSHDLRAPLRALDGFSRMLLERYTNRLDGEGLRMLAILRSESQRMAQLIDDLLAFSRLGRQAVEFKPVDMQALAQSAMDEVMGRNSGRRVEVKLDPLPATRGEQPMLRQVWVNLLDNAIKFTSKSDPARIEIGAEEKPGEWVYYVKDNGVGFDMRYVGKLFDVFQRLHSEKDFAGTGVGLALVKRIIQRHGGRVWAEAELGNGATFYFALPNQKV